MKAQGQARRVDGLLILLLAYGSASLFHHVHNAVFVDEYPNLPAWLSSAGVYAAWVGVTLIGVAGYLLLRRGYRLAGLAVVGLYGAFGLDGLAHYSRAPFSAHTLTMNLTIGLEVATAMLLLIAVAGLMIKRLREQTA